MVEESTFALADDVSWRTRGAMPGGAAVSTLSDKFNYIYTARPRPVRRERRADAMTHCAQPFIRRGGIATQFM